MHTHRPTLLPLVLASLLLAAPVLASEAIIKGKVTDETGKGIADVAIDLHDPGTGRKIHGASEKGGKYYIRGIPPSDYEITFSKEGYTSHTWSGHLTPGKPTDLETIQLQNRAAATKVMEAQAAAMDLGKDFEEGVQKFNAKDYDGAIQSFQRVVEKSPDVADAYYNIGLCYQKKKDFAMAETWLTKTVDKNPAHTGAQFNLAFALYAQSKGDAGLKALEKTLELDPGADTAYNAGALLKNFQNSEDALAMFQEATKRDGSYADAYREIGYIDLAKGDAAGARAALAKYLELAPTADDAAEVKAILDQVP